MKIMTLALFLLLGFSNLSQAKEQSSFQCSGLYQFSKSRVLLNMSQEDQSADLVIKWINNNRLLGGEHCGGKQTIESLRTAGMKEYSVHSQEKSAYACTSRSVRVMRALSAKKNSLLTLEIERQDGRKARFLCH